MLAADLGVSMATIRRDLELLESQRLLSRTHGGAVSHGVLYELPLRYRSGRHEAEKQRIAEAAAERLGDARVVGFTGGTTTTEVARRIAGQDLTVVTNALNIAAELAVRPEPEAGRDRRRGAPESYELVGPLADATLDDLNIDVVVRRRRRIVARRHDARTTRSRRTPTADDRARAPRRRRRRRVEDRPLALAVDLPAATRRRADHRRQRPTPRCSTSCAPTACP